MRRGRLATTEPLISDGRAYISWNLTLSAVSMADGRLLWERSMIPRGERVGIFGGGLALADGTLYVSSGAAAVMLLAPSGILFGLNP